MGYELSFIGLIVTLLFIGVTGIYPGGIIVPSFLVLFVDQPARILSTLIVALLTLICYKIASEYLILFDKRRFAFMILLGGLLTFLWLKIFPYLSPVSFEYRVIGWVIPGLIANNFERQGVFVTSGATITVTIIVYFLGKMFLLGN